MPHPVETPPHADLSQPVASADEQSATESPSDWYQQQMRELAAFEASGYTDLSVLHIDEPAVVAQRVEPAAPEASRPRPHRRLIQSLGRSSLRRGQRTEEAAAATEDQPLITESRLEGDLTMRSYRYPDREVLELTPDVIREDPSTGEPVIPLVFVQGIGGSGELLPKDLASFAATGQRTALGIRMLGKREGTSAKLVDAGLPDRVPLNYFQQSRAILKSLVALGVQKVDIVSVSEGAIPAVIARDEMVSSPDLPEVGDTILVHPQGLDGRSYIGRHRGGARLIRQTKAMHMQHPEGRAKAKGDWNDGQTFRQLNARRKGSAKADIRQTLAATPYSPESQSITIVGGTHDPAISAERLQEHIIDPDRVAFVESDWGGVGHGFGDNRTAAIAELSNLLLAQERSRQLAAIA